MSLGAAASLLVVWLCAVIAICDASVVRVWGVAAAVVAADVGADGVDTDVVVIFGNNEYDSVEMHK
jgi:hypothetical protein